MPQPLRKVHPTLDLPAAQEKVRVALRRAFRVCGSQKHFIERFNAELVRRGRKPVTKQAVSWWASEGTFVDERYWRAFEVVTDYAVTRRHLRPDMYRDE